MVKSNILIFGSLISATILGVFGEGIAYFMNENIASIAPIYYLSAVTYTSVFLYFVTAVLTYVANKRRKLHESKVSGYFLFIGIIGMFTSLWSLFVLAMWWG